MAGIFTGHACSMSPRGLRWSVLELPWDDRQYGLKFRKYLVNHDCFKYFTSINHKAVVSHVIASSHGKVESRLIRINVRTIYTLLSTRTITWFVRTWFNNKIMQVKTSEYSAGPNTTYVVWFLEACAGLSWSCPVNDRRLVLKWRKYLTDHDSFKSFSGIKDIMAVVSKFNINSHVKVRVDCLFCIICNYFTHFC